MISEIFTQNDKVVLFSKRHYQSVNFFQNKIDNSERTKILN